MLKEEKEAIVNELKGLEIISSTFITIYNIQSKINKKYYIYF